MQPTNATEASPPNAQGPAASPWMARRETPRASVHRAPCRRGALALTATAALLVGGCMAEITTEEREAEVALEQQEEKALFLQTERPSRLTFFSEARLWGDSMVIETSVDEPTESSHVITTAAIATADLDRRISSFRLECGSRPTSIALFQARNRTGTMLGWSEGTTSRPYRCRAGETLEVNLHDEPGNYADRIGSAYMVGHAREARSFALSELLMKLWEGELEDLPDGAEAYGEPRVWLTYDGGFRIRQSLKLDHWACSERRANFVLHANVRNSDTTTYVVSSYVHTGTGDLWGCRNDMRKELDAGARAAARNLREGLDTLLSLLPSAPRRYLVPQWGIDSFDVYAGGQPAESAFPDLTVLQPAVLAP